MQLMYRIHTQETFEKRCIIPMFFYSCLVLLVRSGFVLPTDQTSKSMRTWLCFHSSVFLSPSPPLILFIL
jgi:hypothetical protein